MRVLIHRATNLTLDPRIGDLHVDILVEGSRSVAVAPSIPIDDAEVIAAQRMNRAAGFVDSCRHTWQSLLRGAAIDWTFEQYFAGIRGFMGASTLLTISMSQTTGARPRSARHRHHDSL
jgi:5-methylthioadenosine/S-adenosylhomocysteine deaminase